ncbi:hypothetical protein ACFQ69_36745 [Streptomyces sp. NPDC056470]|uniref:hypothetical protein n=1 Tax=Streptomyces sp. NPDC056470 TaxID=3345831 RepID=UPI00369ECF19
MLNLRRMTRLALTGIIATATMAAVATPAHAQSTGWCQFNKDCPANNPSWAQVTAPESFSSLHSWMGIGGSPFGLGGRQDVYGLVDIGGVSFRSRVINEDLFGFHVCFTAVIEDAMGSTIGYVPKQRLGIGGVANPFGYATLDHFVDVPLSASQLASIHTIRINQWKC